MRVPSDAVDRHTVANFGGNVVSHPQLIVRPQSEQELLAALTQYRGRKIRAVGRLHSWSDAAKAEDVLLDLRHFDSVDIDRDEEGFLVRVGSGCQIKRLLAELAKHGLTMPTLGLISEQTIAGATATGTHGSGRNSLSHYLCEVRVAHYDPLTNVPVIRVIQEGDELRAARCSLGCLGIVVSVVLRPREAYRVEEWLVGHNTLQSVLAAEREAPLQQFYFVPWRWIFLGQHRRETDRPRSLMARLYRVYWFLTIDIGLHLVLRLLVQTVRSNRIIRWFYRFVATQTVIRRWHVIDDSAAMLIMEHELFRHIEMELFVKRGDLAAALQYLREVLEFCGGRADALSDSTRQRLAAIGMREHIDPLLGSYVHHYVICVRRVQPDDTLLSMTAGGAEDRYALSLISYAHPKRRESFFRFAGFAARSMAALFDARPHWGKFCPLTAEEIAGLYPQLPAFQAICRQLDPDHRFSNEWTEHLLGLDQAD